MKEVTGHSMLAVLPRTSEERPAPWRGPTTPPGQDTLPDTEPPFLRRVHAKYVFALLACFIAVHAGLLIFDLHAKFAPFLRTDRAAHRYAAIASLLRAENWHGVHDALVGNNIVVGEYVVQAVLYGEAGPLAVVLFQLGLQLLAVLAVFRVTVLVLNGPRLGFGAALLYTFLPHSLVLAHQLSSEAIAVPLLAIAFWLFLEFRVAEKSIWFLMGAGALFGLCACARPILALLPILLMPFSRRVRSPRSLAGTVGFAVVGILPLALWGGFISMNTHQLSLGNANASLGMNLYGRVERISAALPSVEQAAISDRYLKQGAGETLSISDYLSFVMHYPAASVQHFLRDEVTLAVKSGISRLTIDYFDLAPEDTATIQSWSDGWRSTWEQRGLIAAIRSAGTMSPFVVIAELAGAAFFSLFFLCVLVGLMATVLTALVERHLGGRTVGLAVLSVQVFYIFASAQVVDAAQSRHRYPAEFAMSILAVFGATVACAIYREIRGRTAAATTERE